MPRQISRKDLYDLAWAQPVRDIAATFGISDVGLAKHCKKANIPLPPRGYWAKKRSGARVVQMTLPPRLPGAADRVWIGGEPRNWGWGTDWEKATLDEPVPPEPHFDEDIDAFTTRIRKFVGHIPFLRNFQAAFGDVSKLLAQDENRRTSTWDKPLYDSGIARRRLLVLHSLFFAFRRLGCSPSMSTSQYMSERDREIYVRVGESHVRFILDPFQAKGVRGEKKDEPRCLRLALTEAGSANVPARYWEDTTDSSLEQQLTEIVVQILIRGEEQYRASLAYARKHLIEQKERIRIEIQKREEERQRQAREQLEKERKARVEALLAQAADLQKALAIRNYVQLMKNRLASMQISAGEFEMWENWALSEANRIDPSVSLKFLDTIPKKSDPMEV